MEINLETAQEAAYKIKRYYHDLGFINENEFIDSY